MNLYLAILFFLHLLGISIWMGGSFLGPLVILPAVQALDPPARPKFIAEYSKKYTPWVWGSIVVVVVTGVLQTGQLYGFPYLMGVNVLSVKIFVAVLMIANGYFLGMVLSPRAAKLAPAPGSAPAPEFLKTVRLLGVHSWIQAGMGVAVLFLVGLLTA